LADTVVTLDNDTQRQPTTAERAARRALLARGDWPRHLTGVGFASFATMGSRLADVYGAQLHERRYQFQTLVKPPPFCVGVNIRRGTSFKRVG